MNPYGSYPTLVNDSFIFQCNNPQCPVPIGCTGPTGPKGGTPVEASNHLLLASISKYGEALKESFILWQE